MGLTTYDARAPAEPPRRLDAPSFRSQWENMALSVLHVAQPTIGGVARHILALSSDQLQRGFEVVVACPAEGELPLEASRMDVRLLPWTAARLPGPGVALETAALRRIVHTVDPDLVHLHSSKAGLAGRLVLRGRRPTIFQPHAWSFEAVDGFVGRAARAWERMSARWADLIICVSDGERRRGEEAGIRARYRVIPNGIDLEAFPQAHPEEREGARQRLGRAADELLVVCVGRLARAKGQDVLVEAWPGVRTRVPDAALVLVGDGPDAAALRRRRGEGVELVGERSDVLDWLTAADVVVQPSRWEAMSLALLEAMARGRSVVVTDVPGASESLASVNGAVVPIEAPAPLANAIADRLLDPDRAAAEGRENRRRAEAFDVRRTTEAFAELYRELLDGRPRR
jgi:glycosyltransferase involved in cell wall biosynthesis